MTMIYDDAVIDNDNGDDDKSEDKLESESLSSSLSSSSSSSLLFASVLVQRIVTFVKQTPCDFAITILPPNRSSDCRSVISDDDHDTNVQEEVNTNTGGGIIDEDADGDNTGLKAAANANDKNDDVDNNGIELLLLLSKRQRSLLETSIVLIREDVADDDKLEEEEEADADSDADDSDSETNDRRKSNYNYHLGIEARAVPLLARTLRDIYRTTKSKMNMMESSSSSSSSSEQKKKNTNHDKEEEEEENGTTNNNAAINRSSSGRSNLTITMNENEYRLLFDITSCVLLIQPDHSTVWADRRRCILQLIRFQRQQHVEEHPHQHQHPQENQSSPISKNDNDNTTTSLSIWYTELEYVNLLMTQHSKAPSSWAHRKYVLLQIVQFLMIQQQQQQQNPTSSLPVVFLQLQDAVLSNLVMKEMDLCTRIAEQYPKNYYAWTHRIYVWKEIYLLHYYGSLKLMSTTTTPSLTATRTTTTAGVLLLLLLESELRTRMWQEWLPTHPTDHSAIHYSCYLLDHYLLLLSISTDSTDRSVITSEEEIARCAFQQVQTLLAKYPSTTSSNSNSNHSNECIWILRRNTCQIIWKYSRSKNTSTLTSVNDTTESAGSSPTATTTTTTSRSSTSNTNNDADRITTPSNRNRMMRRRMRQLVRDDIKSVIKNTLTMITTTTTKGEDAEQQEDERTNNDTSTIHAWTFVAWCLANLKDIDDDDDDDNDNDNDNDGNTSNENHDTTIIFTQLVREAILRRFSTTTTTATKTTSKRNSTYGRGYYKYVI